MVACMPQMLLAPQLIVERRFCALNGHIFFERDLLFILGLFIQHLIVASFVIRYYLALYRYKNIGVQLISGYRYSDTP